MVVRPARDQAARISATVAFFATTVALPARIVTMTSFERMSSFEEAARSGGAEQRRAANKPSSAGLRATILSV
jgi:hypothetical protein